MFPHAPSEAGSHRIDHDTYLDLDHYVGLPCAISCLRTVAILKSQRRR
jgi:hypothetical protein